MADSLNRKSRSRQAVALMAWGALAFTAYCLFSARSNGTMRAVPEEWVTFILSAFSAFVAVFAWMLFNPARRSAVESPSLAFATLATLLPPPVIGFCLMPAGSPLAGWLALLLFLLCVIAILSHVPEDFFSVPRSRSTYLMPLPAFDRVDGDVMDPNAAWFRFTDLSSVVSDTERPSLAPRAYLQRETVRPQTTTRAEVMPVSDVDDILGTDLDVSLLDDPFWDVEEELAVPKNREKTEPDTAPSLNRPSQQYTARDGSDKSTEPNVEETERPYKRLLSNQPVAESRSHDVPGRKEDSASTATGQYSTHNPQSRRGRGTHEASRTVERPSAEAPDDAQERYEAEYQRLREARTRREEQERSARKAEAIAQQQRDQQVDSPAPSAEAGESRVRKLIPPVVPVPVNFPQLESSKSKAETRDVAKQPVSEPRTAPTASPAADSNESSWRRPRRTQEPTPTETEPVQPLARHEETVTTRQAIEAESRQSDFRKELEKKELEEDFAEVSSEPARTEVIPQSLMGQPVVREQPRPEADTVAKREASVTEERTVESRSASRRTQPKIERTTEEDGTELIEGVMTVRFDKGQKRANLHVPFSPPMANVPEVECECAGDEVLRLKVPVKQSYGIRIEARRSNADEPLETEVNFAAFCTPE